MFRMTSRLALIAATAILPLAACQTSEKAATTAVSAVQAQTTPTLSTTDATFLNTIGTAGAEEVQFGQLAAKQAMRASTRNFAKQMVTQHTAANQQVAMLAQSKQLSASSTSDVNHDQMYSTLQGLKGRAFDKAYLDGQVADHQAVVAAFQDEIANGQDADVKAFAQKNLPTMTRHLAMAKRLDPAR